MQSWKNMTCDCFMTTTVDQMLLIKEKTGSLSTFLLQYCSNFKMPLSVNTLVCLETGEGPCDFIICGQREPE